MIDPVTGVLMGGSDPRKDGLASGIRLQFQRGVLDRSDRAY